MEEGRDSEINDATLRVISDAFRETERLKKIYTERRRDQSLGVTLNLVMCFIMTLFGNEVMNYYSDLNISC